MHRCEDYPCCGHGPVPYGEGGGCPDEQGRFLCVLCGKRMPKGATSSICTTCLTRGRVNDGDPFAMDDEDADRGVSLRAFTDAESDTESDAEFDAERDAMHGLGREDDEAFYGGTTCDGEF